jgi:hypothetical protein
VLDVHGSAWSAGLRSMLTATGLNAGFLIGGDHEFVILQCTALPLTGIQVQHAARFGSEIWIPWKNPTAVIPRPNGVFMEPAPQSASAHGGNQTALLYLLNQIRAAPAGQRNTVRSRQLTSQCLNLNDQIWGKKSGDDPDGHALPIQ